jgi:hypothetical protein
MKNYLFLILCFSLFAISFCASPIFAQSNNSGISGKRWVAWSRNPAIAWKDAFVTGNGRHGTMLAGTPGKERLICVHEELFLRAWDRNKVAVANIAGLLIINNTTK